MAPPAKRAKKEALADVLERLSPNSKDGKYSTVASGVAKINNFLAVVYKKVGTATPTKLTEKRCYFLTSARVLFRHQGDDDKMPSKVFVNDLSKIGETKVVVFHSASGTGKTVELASSAATRGVDFTFVLQFSQDIKAEFKGINPKDGQQKAERNQAALEMIQDGIEKILKGNEESFCDTLCAKKGDFRLAVAIDEAYVCQLLTRALISDHDDYFQSEVANFILEKARVPVEAKVFVHVTFSVGGTGACMKYIGSQAHKFKVVEPTATSSYGLYWKTALREAKICQYLPTKSEQDCLDPDELEEGLPILGCLMQNGRMASIAIGVLLADNQRVPIDEAKLVENIVIEFIQSNGLSRLQWPEKREAAAAVAACAFAVHLFQWNSERCSAKINEAELHKWLYELRSGVEFAGDILDAAKNKSLMTALVAKFGLLEQEHEPFTEEESGDNQQALYSISKPFVMRPSQQLVALHLLGGDISQMVTSNPYGFEVLTTHIIKAALAASSAVAEKSRPSIAMSLKKNGFICHAPTTHDSTSHMFSKLENLKVVRHYFNEPMPGKHSSFDTHHMKVEMEVLKVNGDQGGVMINDSVAQGDHEVVMIDSEVAGRLEKLVYDRGNEECFFYPPIACVNYGNSPLADGNVTVLARDTRAATNPVMRLSVSNQAKDKHSKGGMSITKLNAHADKCANKVLDGLFGSERLLCVSTPERKFSESNNCKIERKFLRYELSKCVILQELMTELSIQRSKQGRIKQHAAFFNSKGHRVDLA